MTKKQAILTHISLEAAASGMITKHALRLYVENRITMRDFNAAVARGMRVWNEREADRLTATTHP